MDEADFADGGTFSGPCSSNYGESVFVTGDIIWNGGTMDLREMFDGLYIENGGSLTIQSGSFTLNDDDAFNQSNLIVNSGGLLSVTNGATLNVELDVTVNGHTSIDGDLNLTNAGSVFVTDSLFVSGNISISGMITEELDGDLVVSNGGVVIVENGGKLDISDDVLVSDGGTVGVQVGGEINVGDMLLNSPEGNPAPPLGNSSQGTFIIHGQVTVENEVYIYDTTPDSEISGTGTLEIVNSGGSYTNLENDFSIDDSNCGGGLTCQGSSVPLPVELISFKAVVNESSTKLIWSTAQEVNNKGFFVEHSNGGSDFKPIGFVSGNGTTNESKSYCYVDQPRPRDSYYRLRQLDLDGRSKLHHVIFVEASTLPKSISIYPNPVSDQLTLIGPEGVYELNVVDQLGREILHRKDLKIPEIEDALNQLMPSLTHNFYTLLITNPNENYQIKFYKKSRP